MFRFIFTGGITENDKTGVRTRILISNRVKKINSKTLKEKGILAAMKIDLFGHKTIYCKGEIYTNGGYDKDDEEILTIEKYSFTTNKREMISELVGWQNYCVNAFMGEIYILGGYYEDTCESFDRKSNNKKDIANMNDVRASAASTIYEKKL